MDLKYRYVMVCSPRVAGIQQEGHCMPPRLSGNLKCSATVCSSSRISPWLPLSTYLLGKARLGRCSWHFLLGFHKAALVLPVAQGCNLPSLHLKSARPKK
eukprot:88690-Pelagomonas_calceolata.AAC.1